MPQELYVLRCVQCETFQAHIVKKEKKWICKMCGLKQSFKRDYGRGTGKDCREQVKKLNMMRMSKNKDAEVKLLREEPEVLIEEKTDLPQITQQSVPRVSKWANFLQDEAQSDDDCLFGHNQEVKPTYKKRKITKNNVDASSEVSFQPELSVDKQEDSSSLQFERPTPPSARECLLVRELSSFPVSRGKYSKYLSLDDDS